MFTTSKQTDMSYEFKNIKVLGYTTDFNQCDCCGKTNLKGTVSILDLIYGVVSHFGTTCAVNADKYDTLDAMAIAKKEIKKVVNEVKDNEKWARIMMWKFKIDASKSSEVIKGYLAHVEAGNRMKPYNWSQYL